MNKIKYILLFLISFSFSIIFYAINYLNFFNNDNLDFLRFSQKNSFFYTVFFVLFLINIAFLYRIYRVFKSRWRVKKAKEILIKLRNFEDENKEIRILSYLRKIDPFVFEEMLLTCFKERGLKIKRNKRYTGDGGIDGRIWIKRKMYFIQAKRYKSYINKKHVEDFINLCQKKKKKGLFIHTGKTGAKSKELFYQSNDIYVISGNLLISLILKRSISLSKEINFN